MRRIGLVLVLGLTLAPVAARAQPVEKVYQVGLLSTAVNPARWQVTYKSFIDALRELRFSYSSTKLAYRSLTAKP
jgi:hypothetical protein